MNRLVMFVMFSVAVSFALPAKSAKGGTYIILGAGAASCGKWTEERHANSWSALIMESWVHGYVSSVNQTLWKRSENIAEGTDTEGMSAWLDSYCASHPLQKLADASKALILELAARE